THYSISSFLVLCALHHAFELLFAGQVLRRPGLLGVSKLGGGVQRPVGVAEMRTRQRAKVGTAGGDDGIHLVSLGDITDRDGGNVRLVSNAIAVGRLIHASILRASVHRGLTGGNVNDISAGA